MMLFEPQCQALRERVLDYIKGKIDESNEIRITFPEGSQIMILNNTFKSYKTPNDKYFAYWEERGDMSANRITDNNTDFLCRIADAIHLLPLKELKNE